MSTTEIPDTVRSIVQRFNERGRVFPKRHAQHDDDPVKVQESADYDDLKRWRQDDSRFGGHVTSYLDEEMPGWRGQKYYLYLPKAKHIVEYYKREQNFALPVLRGDWESSKHSFEEYRSLSESKAFISQVSQGGCPPSLLSYLNREAPNWLSIGQCKAHARLDESFVKAEGIVDRYISRGRKLPKEWRNHKVTHLDHLYFHLDTCLKSHFQKLYFASVRLPISMILCVSKNTKTLKNFSSGKNL